MVEMKKHKMDILGIVEIRWAGSGSRTKDDYLVLYYLCNAILGLCSAFLDLCSDILGLYSAFSGLCSALLEYFSAHLYLYSDIKAVFLGF